MFGLNLWARPFLPPPGGPGAPSMESLAHMARPPTSMASPYLVPGLMHDKSGHMLPHSSLLLYRPGEHLLHPSMLRLEHPGLPGMPPAPERSSLHPPGLHNDDEPYPSAFMPAKRARIDKPSGERLDERPDSGHPGSPEGRCPSTGGRSGSGDNHSPALSARSPLSAGPTSPDRHLHTDGRTPSPVDPAHPRCPVCTLHLNWDEIEAHLAAEFERLKEICGLSSPPRSMDGFLAHKAQMTDGERGDLTPAHIACRIVTSSGQTISTSRYETFLKIRGNRQARLNAKYRPRRKRLSDVEICGREGEEVPRVRDHPLGLPVHALISPSAKSISGSEGPSGDHDTSLRSEEDDKEAEIDVTTPDPSTSCAVDLRMGGSPLTSTSHPLSPGHGSNSSRSPAGPSDGTPNCTETGPLSALPPSHPAAVNNDHSRCHVCSARYNKPVTSLQCWHVHCEGCWLQALSSKQLCPQCNIVTSPSDLRQVFI